MKQDDESTAIRENLGRRIRALREERGMSQYTFARMISMDRSYLIAVEKGRRNISIDNLAKIARGLGISLSYMLEGADDSISMAAITGQEEASPAIGEGAAPQLAPHAVHFSAPPAPSPDSQHKHLAR